MKRIFLLMTTVVLLAAVFTACGQVGLAGEEATPNPYEARIAELEKELDELQQDSGVTVQQDLQPNEVMTPTPAPTPTPMVTPPPIDNPQMYSSYAHMVSYDPATGYAKFDYFVQLRGEEAVDALVAYEGYDEVDAMVEVQNWEEGGFYERNTDKQLRTIDLNKVDVRLIIGTDGMLIGDIGNPSKSGAPEVTAIYNANPVYLYDYFFFWITVNDQGKATKVEQVYRP